MGYQIQKITLHLLLLNTAVYIKATRASLMTLRVSWRSMIFWKRSALSIIELEGKLYDVAVCRGLTTFSYSDFIPVQSPSLQHPPQLFQPMSLPQPWRNMEREWMKGTKKKKIIAMMIVPSNGSLKVTQLSLFTINLNTYCISFLWLNIVTFIFYHLLWLSLSTPDCFPRTKQTQKCNIVVCSTTSLQSYTATFLWLCTTLNYIKLHGSA